MGAFIRLLLLSFVVVSSTAWSQSPNPPIGNADGVSVSGGQYGAWGWACDPDNYSTALTIHLYLDGTYPNGTFVGAVTANAYRGDVVNVCGGTVYHGYGFTIPGQYLSVGQHTLYAFALDNGGAGPNPLLGTNSFTVSAPVNIAPIGNADSAGPSGGGYTAAGWACDPDNYGAALTIHFYLDGTYPSGTFVGAVAANTYRGDVVNVCGGTVYHGYNFTIPPQYLSVPGTHTLYAFALDAGGAGPNPLLGAHSFTVSAPENNAPIGNADTAGASGGAYGTAGWACDPDNYGAALTIQFYLDGTSATGTFVGAAAANAYRGDLVSVCGGTVYHGYNFTIPSQYLSVAGSHTIYAYALDASGVGPNPLLGARSFVVTDGSTPNAPFGSLDAVGQSSGGLVAAGWTCDPDNWGMPLQVRFYLDGPMGGGMLLGSATANADRGDLVNVCGGTVAHGYNFALPAIAPGTHSIYVYAMDNGGVGPNPLLSGAPKSFTALRTDLLYGYYYGCADFAPEQAGHVNLWWAAGAPCSNNSQVWYERMAVELQAARAAGASSIVLMPWPYMVFDPNAQANATSQFQQLAATGVLDGWSSIMIYPQDEPDQNGISDAQMTAAVAMLRNVAAGIPQLKHAKFGVIYNCGASAPGLASFDWVGCDDYNRGCEALSELTSRFPIGANQRYMVVPGGTFGQDPGCFVSFAESDSRVAAVIPFMWQSTPGVTGIRENGLRSTYCQAGRSVIGNPGAC